MTKWACRPGLRKIALPCGAVSILGGSALWLASPQGPTAWMRSDATSGPDAKPAAAAECSGRLAATRQGSGESPPAAFPLGPALLIAGGGRHIDQPHSNLAMTAGLPEVRPYAHRVPELASLVTAAGPAKDRSHRTAGAGGRITQGEIDAMKAGITAVLPEIENAVADQVFGEQLPLVGDGFQVAWVNSVASFRHLTTLRTAILGALDGFNGSADYDPAAVATAIRSALTGHHASTTVTASTPEDGARIDFTTRRDYAAANVPVADDFGFPRLAMQRLAPANATTSASVLLNFSIGVDATGFYLQTQDSLFQFNSSTSASSINTTARLAKLEHTVTHNPASPIGITANFAIQLKEPGGDGKLRVDEIGTMPDLVDATLTGNTRTALKLDANTPANVMFPRVGTDLEILWNFENAEVDPDDDNSTFGSKPVLTLNNNRIALESFLRGFAKNVLDQVNSVTAPVEPVIDVLATPIPLLSDLGSEDVTLLDIFGLPQETQDAVYSLQGIATLADLAETLTFSGSPGIDMGDWSMAAHDPRVDGPEELTGTPVRPPSASRPAALESFLDAADDIQGLDFPLLDDGGAVVDVLLGRNASLFTYRSGKVSISEEFSQYFPVLGPIGITLGGEIGFEAEFGFGYDTEGLFDYFAGGGTDLTKLANGFYAMALDELGDPLTGVSLTAGISAGVELNLIIASAGVEGRIGATIGLYLDDRIGDEDGRIRFDDFASHSIDEWFYASGRLWAGVSAYLEIGWPPFGISFEFDSPEITLLSFDSRPDATPWLAAWSESNPSHLHLNVGDRAILRVHGDNVDTAESFLLSTRLGNSGQELVIEAFGAENSFSTLPTRIVGEANLRGDTLELDPGVPIPAHFHGGPDRDTLRGGDANDVLDGGGGPDHLIGQGGNDTLRGGEDNDLLDGGDGADDFDGGPGDDTAAWTGASVPLIMDLRTMTFGGAAIGDTLVSIERYRGSRFPDVMDGSEGDDLLLHGDENDDLIRGHGGADLLIGGKGGDTIEGGNGDDHIIGGPDPDTLDGGPGIDTLSFLDAAFPVNASLLTGTGTKAEANGDTYTGFEILVGSGLPMEPEIEGFPNGPELSGDILHGDHGPNTVFGMDGADEIHGHGGNDILYGNHPDSPLSEKAAGFEADSIFGGDGDDILHGHGDTDLLDGQAGADTLLGGTGDDHLRDLDPASPDHLDGEDGFDRLTADYSSSTAGLSFIVGQENGRVFPNGDQYHRMETLGEFTTGSGNDTIRLATSPEPQRLDKTIQTGPGDDLVVADTRTSYAQGGRTQDSLHGGDGVDTLSFENSVAGITLNLASNAVGGAAAEMTISGFENLTGSDFDDTLTGNGANNLLTGRGGNDFLTDLDPASVDVLDGGDGHDRLSADYSSQTQVVQFTVGQENSMTFGNGESFLDMETLGQLFTGSGNDMIRLASAPETVRFNKTIDAGPGNDLVIADSRHIYGTAGRSNDSLHGGDGIDTLSFEQSEAGVLVDPTGHLSGLGYPRLGGAAAGLTISGFENLIGTNRVDILAGDNGNNVFTPLAGVHPDELNLDQIYGLHGFDTMVVDYSQDPLANIHGIEMGPNSGSFATINVKNIGGRHYYSSIEQFHVTGSAGPDTMYGELLSVGHDRFFGLGGNDFIAGRAGNDWIEGGEGNDTLLGQTDSDTLFGGPGNDTLTFDVGVGNEYRYGNDLADGGEGNDFISNIGSPGLELTRTGPHSVIRLDGGPGFDVVAVDAGDLTTALVLDGVSPVHFDLPGGGYVRNFERVADITTGSGDDIILTPGRHDNRISTMAGNDTVNPGLGIDFLRGGSGNDNDLLIIDYSLGDDPGLGGVTNAGGNGPIQRRRLSDNVVIDEVSGSHGFERLHFTGTSKNDTVWAVSFNGASIYIGGGGNDTFHGSNAPDWLDGGTGADSLNGGFGDDTYHVDDAGDTVVEPTYTFAGTDLVISSINFTLPVAVENLQLAGNATTGTGNELNNIVTGNTRNNSLSGAAGNDTLNGGGGAREIDTLTGGGNADTFVLGLLGTPSYDDGDASTPGHEGYALITDFTPSQSDRLRLAGAAAQYRLGVSPFHPDDDALYHDSNGNAVLDPESDELIAILQSAETLTSANTIGNAVYQNAIDPSVVGLTAVPVATVIAGASGPQLGAEFCILESPPSNVRIEIIASNDLGIDDPWTVIASKTGTGAWTGPAQVSVSPPANGRVDIRVTDVPQAPRPARRFMAVRLVPP